MLKARLLPVFSGLGLLGALTGCLTPPDYPDKPSIEFKRLEIIRNVQPRPTGTIDTLKITIGFQDGNGDLGLTQNEINFPKPPFNGDNRFNYLLRVFRRTPPATQFEEVYPGEEFGQFYPLNGGPDAKSAPLKGELTFRRAFRFGAPFVSGNEVRCTVSIKDRALNESNTVTSSVARIR